MKFECGDIERALQMPELMPEAREHLKQCAACRREYRLWNEISSAAKELHEEWQTPTLWPSIRKKLEAEPKTETAWWQEWRMWAIAATVVIAAILIGRPWQWMRTGPQPAEPRNVLISANQDFLTEETLKEVERNEAAYRQSIEKLSRLAKPKLEKASSPLAVTCKEKLLMLDSAISDTRSSLEHNRFNVRLQTDLADLYLEKQQTLKELLTGAQKN
jgi:predicted anti-sigma-YlaC factor YlaD